MSVEATTVFRVRVAYAHTLKEGWRVSETTVEATGVEIDHQQMAQEARKSHEEAAKEAQRRNRSDRGMVERESSN